MSAIEKLAEYFSRFPGIGPRQSRRFVYFLLKQDPALLNGLGATIANLQKGVRLCTSCHRFFGVREKAAPMCPTCASANRDAETLMVVEKDVDFENIERAGSYRGYYFVLGGALSLLKRSEQTIRSQELVRAVEKRAREGLREVILALSASPDGEYTAAEMKKLLAPLADKHGLTVSTLGRGLSTGLELEYSDSETIKNALKNRA